MGDAGGEQHIKKAPCYRALPLLIYPAPAASSSCLRTFRIRRQKAPFMRKNLSQSELNEPLSL
ncbi:hypothetical protein EKQ63_27195 [Bacillus sp. BD59S]|nr:hypothetical protein EKQ63_27195 [Bacillus sp. BD59S]